MLVILQFLLFIGAVNSARILGVVLSASYSHQVVFHPLWKELSLRGHQVTTITTHPIKDSSLVNLTEIDTSGAVGSLEEVIKDFMEAGKRNAFREIYNSYILISGIIDKQLKYPPVQVLINDKNLKFDLVIVEYLWDSVLAFAERFNCPSIGMVSIDGTSTIYKRVGNPTHSTIYPDLLLPFGYNLSLYERITSFVYEFGVKLFVDYYVSDLDQKIVQSNFDRQYPPIKDMAENISLLFVNSDPISHSVRPLVPAVIQLGVGFHRTKPKALPTDLKKVLDKASNGVIYFSLGSNVKSEYLSTESINMILEVFSELPYTILWKFGEEMLNIPKNVVIKKWLPQQDVLEHPNIKLFITQGGLQSMEEAIFAQVPMIAIPFLGDQPYNAKRIFHKGLGLHLDYTNLKKAEFKETILEVINNPKYRDNITKLSKLVQDQPMTGLEKAVWWTEYVIRHKGARHLRSPLLDIPWYQYLLLDVIAALLLVILVIVGVIYFILKSTIRLIKYCCCSKSKSKLKKN